MGSREHRVVHIRASGSSRTRALLLDGVSELARELGEFEQLSSRQRLRLSYIDPPVGFWTGPTMLSLRLAIEMRMVGRSSSEEEIVKLTVLARHLTSWDRAVGAPSRGDEVARVHHDQAGLKRPLEWRFVIERAAGLKHDLAPMACEDLRHVAYGSQVDEE
jgi:hypothetical protein